MIVVIGATGFVGSHLLCRFIKTGVKVKALYRNKEKINDTRKIFSYYSISEAESQMFVEWCEADILDYQSLIAALRGAQYVYNCSGFVSFDKRDRDAMINVNYYGTRNIVNACLLESVKKLIHLSSIAAIGETNSSEEITEDNDWIRSSSESWYSITKHAAEMEVWRGIAEGLNAVIVNPSVIIGPGDWTKGSPSLIKTVDNGLRYFTNGIVGFVDVRDVCKAMIQLGESHIVAERFILSSENLSFKDCFTTIAKALGKKPPQKQANALMLAIAWRLALIHSKITGKAPVITKSSAKTALKINNYSHKKITTTFDFQFTSIYDSIDFTVKCYLLDRGNEY